MVTIYWAQTGFYLFIHFLYLRQVGLLLSHNIQSSSKENNSSPFVPESLCFCPNSWGPGTAGSLGASPELLPAAHQPQSCSSGSKHPSKPWHYDCYQEDGGAG